MQYRNSFQSLERAVFTPKTFESCWIARSSLSFFFLTFNAKRASVYTYAVYSLNNEASHRPAAAGDRPESAQNEFGTRKQRMTMGNANVHQACMSSWLVRGIP